ncbi:MAG: hypothetical protein D6753_09235 [Planctomycetota bacterium]|nr:MAG: hypothetical protein D6753_09235 [Planctomycetota bacterium]
MSSSSSAPSSLESHRPERLPASHFYDACIGRAKRRSAELEHRNTWMAWLRTFLFLVAAAFLIVGYGSSWNTTLALAIGWLALGAFVVAIVVHEQWRLQVLECESDIRLFQFLLARTQRDWDQLPDTAVLPEFAETMFVDDLDVGGRASLLTLVSLARTPVGNRTVQSWIFTPPSWEEVRTRQQAVEQLAVERDLRIALLRELTAIEHASGQPYGLEAWAAEPNWLKQHRVAHGLSLAGMAAVLVGASWTASLAWNEQREMIGWSVGLLAAGFAINILVTVLWGSWIHGIFHRVAGEHRTAHRLSRVFQRLGDLPDSTSLLQEIRRSATGSPTSATRGFASLRTLVRMATLQRDPLLYVIYLVLQLSLAWDFWVLWLLERWKRRFGPQVGDWFHALGQYEALASAATLADEHQQWQYATEPEDPDVAFHAEEMGHPLLPVHACVPNSFTLDKHAPLMLVTGSNMAGKSTFLRAVGSNILLARLGAPCCAAGVQTAMYELATSIRIRDSLSDGVSFFMAELQRLKQVVDLAERHRDQAAESGDPHPVMFLLDEILQGTNSRERLIAVRKILNRLLETGAVGFVSTHDLDLAACEEIRRVAQIVHFREYFVEHDGQPVMQFDYRMRPGPTPTTNALKLLRLVGLDADTCTEASNPPH